MFYFQTRLTLLQIQNIRSEFTVQVYETHARIALENVCRRVNYSIAEPWQGDHADFNQCQTQLLELYEEGLPACPLHARIALLSVQGSVEEFTAYFVLYNVYCNNSSASTALFAELTETLRASAAIKHALAVRSAQAAGNYNRLFKLYAVRGAATTSTAAQLLHRPFRTWAGT